MQHITDCFLRRSPSDVVVEGSEGSIKAGGIALAFRQGRVLIEASLRRELLDAQPDNDLQQLHRLGLFLGLKAGSSSVVDLPLQWQGSLARRVEQRFGDPHWNHG